MTKDIDEFIPEIIIQNIAKDVNSICPEIYQLFRQCESTNLTQHLQDNIVYFKNTCAYLEKQSVKQVSIYKYMEENGMYFMQTNPFAVLDCMLLYSKTLIEVLDRYEELLACKEISAMPSIVQDYLNSIIKDMIRVISYFLYTDVNDARVANFYLLNQTVH